MSTSPRTADASERSSFLNEAIELAFVTARRDASTPGAPPPPAGLRPVLSFARLPRRARKTVYDVVDSDAQFRRRVVEEVDESSVQRSTWLFLARPTDWELSLELLIDEAAEHAAIEQEKQEEASARRRLATIEQADARLHEDLRAATAARAAAESALADERTRRDEVERSLEAMAGRSEALDEDLAHAVRSLTDAKKLAANRLEALRSAEERIAELEAERSAAAVQSRGTVEMSTAPAPPTGSVSADAAPAADAPARPTGTGSDPSHASGGSPWDGTDPAQVAAAVSAAASAADALGVALAAAARLLQVDPGASAGASRDTTGGATDEAAQTRASRPARRSPLRLRSGAVDGSVDGIDQLLRTPGVIVMVDGYNVSMSGWPSLGGRDQRDALVAALGAAQVRTGAAVHVVFDGVEDGRRPSVGAPLPVRVHFSPDHTEADDVVLDMVQRTPTDVAVVVVSSDRRVQDGARRLGANVVSSEQLLRYLRR